MIIRSQNKAFIINFENVDTVCLGGIEEKSVITFTDAQVVTLGTYSTEAKAIKVLGMICDSYCKMKSCDCIFSGYSIDLCKASQEGIDNFIETNRKLYVFEMPQDSEV